MTTHFQALLLVLPSLMKRIIVLVMFFYSTVLFATADGPDYWKVDNVTMDDSLNMREKPDWRSKKVTQIPYNSSCLQNLACIGGLTFQESTELSPSEKIKILKKRPRWCKIKFNNEIGWVSATYLIEGQESKCYK